MAATKIFDLEKNLTKKAFPGFSAKSKQGWFIFLSIKLLPIIAPVSCGGALKWGGRYTVYIYAHVPVTNLFVFY